MTGVKMLIYSVLIKN